MTSEQIRRAAQQFSGAVEVVHDDPSRQPYVPLGPVEPTGEGTCTPSRLDAAEARVAEVLQEQACDDFDAEARAVVRALRPLIYREAAARLHEPCDRDGHGSDCLCTTRVIAVVLEHWADEMAAVDRGEGT